MADPPIGVDYNVEQITPHRVDGWAWVPSRAHEVLTVELVSANGLAESQTIADRFRVDLSIADKRAGWCAFSLPIPQTCAEGIYRLRFRLGAEWLDLGASFRHSPQLATE